MLQGGTEMGCLSTSSSVDVIVRYAKSNHPLLLRIKVTTPMQRGASIKWLSMFPEEEEFLYPPLTYLKPLFKQKIKGCSNGLVVTVVPSFPS